MCITSLGKSAEESAKLRWTADSDGRKLNRHVAHNGAIARHSPAIGVDGKV